MKRFLIGLLTLGLCVGLTACGPNGGTAITTTATDGVTTTEQTKDGSPSYTSTPTTNRAITTEQVSTTDSIVIGQPTDEIITSATTEPPRPVATYPVSEQPKDGYTLKVISYNIQTTKGTALSTDYRAEMLKTFIDEWQPDSIGLQEVNAPWHPRLDGVAFNSSYVGVGYSTSDKIEACSVYYRADKFDLVNSGTFWLSDTPEVRDSKFEDASEPRVCTWVHLKEKKTGLEYVHINTHLANDSYPMRQKQLAVITDRMQRFGDLPIVFTGDFNQSTIGRSMPWRFADARATAAQTVPSDDRSTLVRYQDPASQSYNPAGVPLDFIFYTKEDFTPTVYKNIHHNEDGLWMSDHLPQYCELQFK